MNLVYYIFSLLISLLAIVLSALALKQNISSSKRLVRINRIEEMLEIIHSLMGNYIYFYDTYEFKNSLIHDEKISANNKYNKQINALKAIAEKDNSSNKLSRLYVLNNSYLPSGQLKSKIGIYITVTTSAYENLLTKPYETVELPFNKIPKPWDLLKYYEEIFEELVNEMDLGYKFQKSDLSREISEFKDRFDLN